MSFRRSERVQELLRHEISRLVQGISDPRLGFVTITAVHLSDDLSDAKVYYSVFGSNEERETSSHILVGSIPSIRRDLGKRLESLRRIPTLQLVYDETPERAQKVTDILNQLSKEQAAGAGVPPRPEKPARKTKGKSNRNPA